MGASQHKADACSRYVNLELAGQAAFPSSGSHELRPSCASCLRHCLAAACSPRIRPTRTLQDPAAARHVTPRACAARGLTLKRKWRMPLRAASSARQLCCASSSIAALVLMCQHALRACMKIPALMRPVHCMQVLRDARCPWQGLSAHLGGLSGRKR